MTHACPFEADCFSRFKFSTKFNVGFVAFFVTVNVTVSCDEFKSEVQHHYDL